MMNFSEHRKHIQRGIGARATRFTLEPQWHDEPDYKALGKAFVSLAMMQCQLEADAQKEHEEAIATALERNTPHESTHNPHTGERT